MDLTPGKYSVKALIPSAYRVIESLPKLLTVLDMPKVLINTPTTVVYGGDLSVSIRLSPSMKGPSTDMFTSRGNTFQYTRSYIRWVCWISVNEHNM